MLQQPMLEPASGRVSPRSHGGWSALAQLGIISSIIVSNIGLSMMISHYSRNLRLQLDSALTHQAVSGIVPGVALSLSLSLFWVPDALCLSGWRSRSRPHWKPGTSGTSWAALRSFWLMQVTKSLRSHRHHDMFNRNLVATTDTIIVLYIMFVA